MGISGMDFVETYEKKVGSSNASPSNASHEELWQKALLWTPLEWQRELPKLSAEQIALLMPAATYGYDQNTWQLKTRAAIFCLSAQQQLEAMGKVISIAQGLEILASAAQEPSISAKLSPLLVGMPAEIFRELLSISPLDSLMVFKQEALTEALQHKLTNLVYDMLTELQHYETRLASQAVAIKQLSLADIDAAVVIENKLEIKQSTEIGTKLLNTATRALVIAWNTDRLDIIEQLSYLKEHTQKILIHYIGKPATKGSKATGLWSALEERLHSVFICRAEHEAKLHDDEPAMEALAHFDIWYIEDYWEIGLLPQIKSQEEIRQLLDNPSKEQLAMRQDLFLSAYENLKRLGLGTIGDLKEAGIFSRKALTDYIRAHSQRLMSRA